MAQLGQSAEQGRGWAASAYERSIFGGTAVLFGDQRWKAALTVEHHWLLVWHRVLQQKHDCAQFRRVAWFEGPAQYKSPPTLHRYGCSFGWYSNCSCAMYSCSHGATSVLTVVFVGPARTCEVVGMRSCVL
jgi:hypothetical protein